MRVLICPDKFAGTLRAVEAADGDRRGLARRRRPATSWSTAARWPTAAPASSTCCAAVPGARWCRCRPSIRSAARSPAQVLVAGGTAYVESAQACGLHLLAAAERDPQVATSYGLGALVAAAVEARGPARSWSAWAGRPPTTAAPGCWPRSARRRWTPRASRCRTAGAALPRLRRARRRAARLRGATPGRRDRRGQPADRAARRDRRSSGRRRAPSPADVAAAGRGAGALRRRAGARPARCPPGLAALPGAGAAGGLGAAMLALGGRLESGIGLVAPADRPRRAAGRVRPGASPARAPSTSSRCAARSSPGWPAPPVTAACPAWCWPDGSPPRAREAAAAGVTAAYSLVEHFGCVGRARWPRPAEGLRAARPPGWPAAVESQAARVNASVRRVA